MITPIKLVSTSTFHISTSVCVHVCAVGTFKIYSLSNLHAHAIVVLTIITLPSMGSPNLLTL